MRYRAFWKSTWYECEDYGALCRCLACVGAKSFIPTTPVMDIQFCDALIFDNTVFVEKIVDGKSADLQCFSAD